MAGLGRRFLGLGLVLVSALLAPAARAQVEAVDMATAASWFSLVVALVCLVVAVVQERRRAWRLRAARATIAALELQREEDAATIARQADDLRQVTREAAQARADTDQALGTLGAVVDNVNIGVTLLGPDRIVRWVNRYHRDLFHYPPNTQIEGRSAAEITRFNLNRGLFLTSDQRTRDFLDKRLNPGRHDRAASQTELALADGGVLIIRDIPLGNGDTLVTQYDVTALKAAQRQAEAATRARSAFLANMSHEIRTPLNAIVNLTHLVRQTALPPDQQEALGQVEAAGHLLLGIANDILDVSKIEAGRMDLEQIPFALDEVLRQVVAAIGPRVRADAVTLHLSVEPDLPPVLMGDPLRLSQVLINLGANAAKFTHTGEIRLSVRHENTAAGAAMFRFEVVDTGIGMDETQVDSLFEAFRQADVSTTRRFGGTGLGLSIAKSLTELMGGSIGVTSAPGQGSTFWFTARFLLPQVEETVLSAPDPSVPVSVLNGLRVLVAEDNPVNRSVAQGLLQRMGVEVVFALSGLHAVERLRTAANSHFDAVLMDIQMPEMDGIEATRRIRQELGRRDLPIIALTAHASPAERVRCLEAGMVDHLSKPVDPARLYATLARHAVVPPEHRWPRAETRGKADTPVAPITNDSSLPDTLPGFDVALGTARFLGDQVRLRRMMEVTAKTLPADMASVRAALAAGDVEGAGRLAHGLCGSLGNIGATVAFEAAKALETVCRDGDRPSMLRAAAQLETATEALVQVVAALPPVRAVETMKPRYKEQDDSALL